MTVLGADVKVTQLNDCFSEPFLRALPLTAHMAIFQTPLAGKMSRADLLSAEVHTVLAHMGRDTQRTTRVTREGGSSRHLPL